ncbi:MAG TPA: hypothetical protein VHQ47_03275 [Phycisphaerae bacterium]|nr:hypothetical protein [Phycisphaerae bacterium]
MSFYVSNQQGESERDVTPERMAQLLVGIDPADVEHPDVWLTHSSGWTISVFGSGLVILTNLAARGTLAMHQRLAGPLMALPLWEQLARGDVAGVQARPWQPGYGGVVAR